MVVLLVTFSSLEWLRQLSLLHFSRFFSLVCAIRLVGVVRRGWSRGWSWSCWGGSCWGWSCRGGIVCRIGCISVIHFHWLVQVIKCHSNVVHNLWRGSEDLTGPDRELILVLMKNEIRGSWTELSIGFFVVQDGKSPSILEGILLILGSHTWSCHDNVPSVS